MKAFPAGMELFPSADDEQWEFIQNEILSSDYYVVIVAGMYGSVASDGVSFTEKKFDFAVRSGKPIMSFLFHDLRELKGSQLEEDLDRRDKLKSFREKVAGGKLVKFYRNSDELKSQVWQSISVRWIDVGCLFRRWVSGRKRLHNRTQSQVVVLRCGARGRATSNRDEPRCGRF